MKRGPWISSVAALSTIALACSSPSSNAPPDAGRGGSSDATNANNDMGGASQSGNGLGGAMTGGAMTGGTMTGGTMTGGTMTGGGGIAGNSNGGAVAFGGSSAAGANAGGNVSSGAGGTASKGCDFNNPSGKVVLFDGTSLDGWVALKGGPAQWKLNTDKTMEVVPVEPPTNIQSKVKFEDLCLHLEYWTPSYPASVTGQDRGNSGVYLKSAYEMQILDSASSPADINTCGAVYGISRPLVVACNPELVWNTYEIEFRASVWNQGGQKLKNAVIVSATLNGKLVQKDVELTVPSTQSGQPDAPGPQPLMLQDHRNPDRFRNIWATLPTY